MSVIPQSIMLPRMDVSRLFLCVVVFILASGQSGLILKSADAQPKVDPYTGAPIQQTSGGSNFYEIDPSGSASQEFIPPNGSLQDAGSQGYTIGEPEPDFYTLSQQAPQMRTRSRQGNGGAGFWVKLQHQAGKTIGRNESITELEFFPYTFTPNDGVLFGTLNFYRTNKGEFGGNGGVGYRQYIDYWDSFLGASVAYDRDATRGEAFEQTTVSLEGISPRFDWRVNMYMPFGEKRKETSNIFIPGSSRLVGNNLVFDSTRTFSKAFKGFDMEFGIPLQNDFARKHDIRAHAGFYVFQDNVSDDVKGWKGRLTANAMPGVDMQLEVTRDNTFDTRVQFGASWTFNPHRKSTKGIQSTWQRMTQPVQRLHTMLIVDDRQLDAGQIALNPDTGTPYIFRHVDSSVAGPGTGTVTDPFQTIQLAQGAPGAYDIIYTHADSVFNGVDAGVTTVAGTRTLGEGDAVTHLIDVVGIGIIDIPRATAGTAIPILNNAVGHGVLLNSNSEFSGFVINTPGGSGIFASGGTSNTVVRSVTLNTPTDRGLLLTGTTGTMLFDSVAVNTPGGNAFEVTGGNADITFSNSSITNTSGRALLVDSTTGGFVNMQSSTLTDTGGEGILINNVAGVVSVADATITDSTTTGVDIQSLSGSAVFSGTNVIDNATGTAFNVENTAVNSRVTANNLTINNRNDIGINLRSIDGTASFQNTTTLNTPASGTGTGITFQDSDGAVSFETLTLNGSNGLGIDIGEVGTDNTGSFTVTSLANISNTTDTALSIEDDAATIDINALTISSRTAAGIIMDTYSGTANFTGTATVENQLNSNFSAVSLTNNTGPISFEALTITNGLGNPAANIVDNTGAIALGDVNIDSTGTVGLFADTNTSLSSTSGTITTTTETAVDVMDSTINLILTAVNSTNAINGIRLTDNDGVFSVLGLTNNLTGDGGTISGHSGSAILLTDNGADNTETYTFNEMLLDLNDRGIEGLNIQTTSLTSTDITRSTREGIRTLDSIEFFIDDAVIEGNGSTENSILHQVQTVREDPDFYEWNITNSTISHLTSTGDAILYEVLVGGEDSELRSVISDSTLSSALDGVSLINNQWDGTLRQSVLRNTTNQTGANSTFYLTENLSTTEATSLDISENDVVHTGSAAVGTNVTTNFDSSLRFFQNVIRMTGGDGTGMIFNLAANANLVLDSNEIRETSNNGTGFLFQVVNGSSLFTINNNLVVLTDNPGVAGFETGFNFQIVNGLITLSGNVDNIVTVINPDGAEAAIIGPAPNFTGSFLLNGTNVP